MDAKLVRCRDCGEPLGYLTITAKDPAQLRQLLQDAKLIAVCIECSQKKRLPWKTS